MCSDACSRSTHGWPWSALVCPWSWKSKAGCLLVLSSTMLISKRTRAKHLALIFDSKSAILKKIGFASVCRTTLCQGAPTACNILIRKSTLNLFLNSFLVLPLPLSDVSFWVDTTEDFSKVSMASDVINRSRRGYKGGDGDRGADDRRGKGQGDGGGENNRNQSKCPVSCPVCLLRWCYRR